MTASQRLAIARLREQIRFLRSLGTESERRIYRPIVANAWANYKGKTRPTQRPPKN